MKIKFSRLDTDEFIFDKLQYSAVINIYSLSEYIIICRIDILLD